MYLETNKARKEVPEDIYMLQNNGTNPVGLYFREEMSVELTAGAFYIELNFKQADYRAGFVFEYKGPDNRHFFTIRAFIMLFFIQLIKDLILLLVLKNNCYIPRTSGSWCPAKPFLPGSPTTAR